jgi:hypothetical protein
MTETISTCQIHQKYLWIDCQNPARPGDADGFCILHSQGKEKNPDDFKVALQARWNQADQKSYDFQGIFFPGPFDPDEVFGSREFNKPVDFFGATFTGLADFSGVSIGGRVVFRAINPQKDAGRAPPFIGDFRDPEFQDRGVLRFQDTSLAQISFEGTDLRRPEFHHVTWNSYQGRPGHL